MRGEETRQERRLTISRLVRAQDGREVLQTERFVGLLLLPRLEDRRVNVGVEEERLVEDGREVE